MWRICEFYCVCNSPTRLIDSHRATLRCCWVASSPKNDMVKLPIAFPVVLTHLEVKSDIASYIAAGVLALISSAGLGVSIYYGEHISLAVHLIGFANSLNCVFVELVWFSCEDAKHDSEEQHSYSESAALWNAAAKTANSGSGQADSNSRRVQRGWQDIRLFKGCGQQEDGGNGEDGGATQSLTHCNVSRCINECDCCVHFVWNRCIFLEILFARLKSVKIEIKWLFNLFWTLF